MAPWTPGLLDRIRCHRLFTVGALDNRVRQVRHELCQQPTHVRVVFDNHQLHRSHFQGAGSRRGLTTAASVSVMPATFTIVTSFSGMCASRPKLMSHGQIRNCSSIHSIPGAFVLVTIGPSMTMRFGIGSPVSALAQR